MKSLGDPLTYNQKCQNVLGKDIETEQGHNKRITNEDDDSLTVHFSSIKQHNPDKNIILNNQNDIFEVVRPSILIRIVIKSGYAVTDNFNGQ